LKLAEELAVSFDKVHVVERITVCFEWFLPTPTKKGSGNMFLEL